MQFYKLFPWIKDEVRGVFISPQSDNVDDSFYIKSDLYESATGEYFYRPKEKYFRLQCYGTDKRYNDEEPEIIHINWRQNKKIETYSLKIGILTVNKGFIIQNDEILNAEEDFIDNWLGNSDKKYDDLLNSKIIPSDAKTVAKNEILRALTSVIPNAEILYTNRILTNIIEKMVDLSANTKDFFLRVADLIVFINPNIDFVSSIFIKRLANMQYKPEILPLLTPVEKMPEIFADDRIPETTVDKVNSSLHFQIEKVFEELMDYTIMYNVIPTRKATRPFQRGVQIIGKDAKMIIGLPEWKTACKNANDVENVNDEDLVFYKDEDEVYCFEIDGLMDRFAVNDFFNEYTGKNFSDEFVRRFLSIYSKPIRAEQPKQIEPVSEKPLEESSLIKLIKAEILRLENNLINSTIDCQQVQSKCFQCKIPIPAGTEISSIYKGSKVSFCNMNCFETNSQL